MNPLTDDYKDRSAKDFAKMMYFALSFALFLLFATSNSIVGIFLTLINFAFATHIVSKVSINE